MRIMLAVILVVALTFSAGIAWAEQEVDDGLINRGHFDEIHYGPGGESICKTWVELKGGGSWSGIYDYDDYKWICIKGDPEIENITIVCDIEMYCSEELDANKVYFHIADNTQEMKAVINGKLCSNNGQWVGLLFPPGKGPENPPKLVFREDGFGRTFDENKPDPIPVEFWFKDCYNSEWREGKWDYGNQTQWGIWWLVNNGEPCCCNFSILIKIKPKHHQPDGRYELDPILTAAPVL